MRDLSRWVLVTVLALGYCAAGAGAEDSGRRDPTVSAMEKKYGLQLLAGDVPPPSNQSIKFKQLSASELPTLMVYLRLFAQEFNKYPPAYVKACNISRIAFAKEMTVDGQDRTAIPDQQAGIVYYDPFGGDYNDEYQRQVVHHEFFHVADERLIGFDDPNWAAMNDPKFHYGTGGKNARGGDQGGATNRENGFVNRYSTSAIEEDRAEIFAWMWIQPEMGMLAQRIQGDEILRRKVDYMRAYFKYYSVDAKDEREQKSRRLFAAIRAHEGDHVSKLIDADPSLASVTDWYKRRPLHWAAIKGETAMAKRLLELKSPVDAVDSDGWTALHVAAFRGDVEMIKILLNANANAGLRDKRGGTPAQWAALKGRQEAAKLLAAAQANVKSVSRQH